MSNRVGCGIICDAVPFGLHRPVVEATSYLPGVQVSA